MNSNEIKILETEARALRVLFPPLLYFISGYFLNQYRKSFSSFHSIMKYILEFKGKHSRYEWPQALSFRVLCDKRKLTKRLRAVNKEASWMHGSVISSGSLIGYI